MPGKRSYSQLSWAQQRAIIDVRDVFGITYENWGLSPNSSLKLRDSSSSEFSSHSESSDFDRSEGMADSMTSLYETQQIMDEYLNLSTIVNSSFRRKAATVRDR